MKKIFFAATLVAFTLGAFAQNVDLRRKIEVSGSAEQEVTPDIINVSLSLQEYMDGKAKITIDQLEGQLDSAVRAAGVAKEDFTITNVSGYNGNSRKKRDPGFLASKQYSIRFHSLDKFNQIVSDIDPKGVQSTNIDSYDYSKMSEVKKQLKIQALLAARDKATYLLSSIDEKLGDAIEITETDNNGVSPMRFANSVMAANTAQPSVDIDYKKIKLSYQINAVFEIVK